MIIWLYLSFYELTNTSVLSKILLKKNNSFIVMAYKPYHCCFQAAATSPLRAALSPAWRTIREQIKLHVSKGPQEWTLADNSSQHHPQHGALGSLWAEVGGRENHAAHREKNGAKDTEWTASSVMSKQSFGWSGKGIHYFSLQNLLYILFNIKY